MSLLGKTGLEISRVGLGTVEIGIADYAVGQKGLMPETDAIRLLQEVVDLGVTYIDTARGYGLAEERIGKSGITKKDGVVIGTKCAQFLKQEPDLRGAELEKRIRDEIDTSRTNLDKETLQLVQIHMELPDYTDLRELVEIMQKLKDEGKIAHVGIATRGKDVPMAAMDINFFETIQTAYSIVDQRMAASVLPRAQKEHVGVINRSALLKGSLTPARINLPERLQPLKDVADKAELIAKELGIDLPQLAIRFCLSNPAVSTVLIGTTKSHRIEQALEALTAGSLPSDVLQELEKIAITDPDQIDPARWPKN